MTPLRSRLPRMLDESHACRIGEPFSPHSRPVFGAPRQSIAG